MSRFAVVAAAFLIGSLVQGGASDALPGAATGHRLPAGLGRVIRARFVAQPTSPSSFNSVASLSVPSGSVGGFGRSVAFSSDGTTAIVGAAGEDGGAGAAYIFHSNAEGGWTSDSLPAVRLTNTDEGSQDHFGSSVAISADGKTVMVGAPGVGGDVGAAYLFRAGSEASWGSPTQLATLGDGANPSDSFGSSVALSADGTTALVNTYVFHVSAATAWTSSSTPTAKLSDGSGTPDGLGSAVSLSSDGTTAFLAAPGANSGAGLGYVFHSGGETSWASATSPVAALGNSGGSNSDDFGGAVALSADGTTAVVGAAGAGSANQGAADVFHVSAETAWTSTSSPTAILKKPSGEVDDRFGLSVAIASDGTTILVGGSWEELDDDDGAALLFHVTSADSWVNSESPAATLTNAAAAGAGEQLGQAVGLTSDGTVAVAAADVISAGGALDVFASSSESSWVSSSAPRATLESDAPVKTGIGVSVELSADGTTALVGTTELDQHHGGALLFHVSSPGGWVTSSSPTASLMVPGPTSTAHVALSADGTTAFVAAPSTGPVAVYVFHASNEASWTSSVPPIATLSIGSQPCNDASVAVSEDGTTVVVGCPSGTSVAGAAYVFHVATEGTWTTTSTPSATLTDGHSTEDDFGTSVALSAGGTTAVIGAPGAEFNRSGAAYVFHASAEGDWASTSAPKATLADLDGSFQDLAGESVAISPDGTTVLLGAPFARNTAGVVYVFDVPSAAAWGTLTPSSATLTQSAGFNDDDFGTSVSLSSNGTSAFVASPRDGVYLFQTSSERDWATQSLSSATLIGGGGESVALSGDRGVALVGDGFPGSEGGQASIFALPAEAETLRVSTAGEGAGAVTSSPSGIDCGSTCGHDFRYATLVTLTAEAASGSTFVGWSGACTGSRSTCTIRMSQAQSVTATFQTPQLLTVAKTGSGHGTVTSAPAGIDCGSTCSHDFPYGASVTLTATTHIGSRFKGWSGRCSGFGKCSVRLIAAQAVISTFGQISCRVPNVKGKTLSAAETAIRLGHCRLGKVDRAFSAKVRKGRVLSQKPRHGRRRAYGAKVDLVVSKGRRR